MVNVTPPPTLTGKRFLSATQHQQVAAVLEAIWPGGPDNPGARDAGAADYLDLLLGCDDSVYYDIPNWRSMYGTGLAALNAVALGRPGIGKPLEQLTPAEMTGILKDLAAGTLDGFPDAAWQRRFFGILRGHAIEGCLADARWGGNQKGVIWKWLGYPNGKAKNARRDPDGSLRLEGDS
jgi:gluconate 2-dehydrogenase gamma chain